MLKKSVVAHKLTSNYIHLHLSLDWFVRECLNGRRKKRNDEKNSKLTYCLFLEEVEESWRNEVNFIVHHTMRCDDEN